MDSLLKGLFGDKDDDEQTRSQAQDFVNRYEDGPPHENITGEEAVKNYQAVAGRLSPQELEDSAAEAYERMTPDQRRQFSQFLQEQSGGETVQISDDPRSLAQTTSRLQSEQPDGIAGLLGGMGGSGLGGMLGGVLGGNDSDDRTRNQAQTGGGLGGMLNNPIARAALGGIAAVAMRKILSR